MSIASDKNESHFTWMRTSILVYLIYLRLNHCCPPLPIVVFLSASWLSHAIWTATRTDPCVPGTTCILLFHWRPWWLICGFEPSTSASSLYPHKMDVSSLSGAGVCCGWGQPALYGFIFSWLSPLSEFHLPFSGYLPQRHSLVPTCVFLQPTMLLRTPNPSTSMHAHTDTHTEQQINTELRLHGNHLLMPSPPGGEI